jgi:hypothetical protein
MSEVPPDTILTPEMDGMLVSKRMLIDVSNLIGKKRGQKVGQNEVQSIIKFCGQVRPSIYHGRRYDTAVAQVADDWAQWWRRQQSRDGRGEFMLEEDDNAGVSGSAEYAGGRGTVAEYSKSEIMQFTGDESQFKFAAFQDRRGNAVIDQERVAGHRSSPNNIKPVRTPDQRAESMAHDIAELNEITRSFLSPKAVDHMMGRLQGYMMNTNNVTLVHQTVAFDSRNRMQSTGNFSQGPGAMLPGGNFRWELNAAAVAGNIGSIRLQDTLQQIIEMDLAPFWLPIGPNMIADINTYQTVRLFIQEFAAQAITVAEYNDPTRIAPTFEPYHFELDVERTVPATLVANQPGRAYVRPRQPFRFRKPMAKNLDTITTILRTPYQPAALEFDSAYFTVTYGNPTTFTITTPTILPILITGDLVYVYNAAPNGTGANTLTGIINNPAGHQITVISTTQFSIAVNSTTGGPDQTYVLVYFANKRIFFQIKFLSLEQ